MTKTVIITGATSGFGAAAVRRFVKGGWRAVATGRRADRLQALAEELGPKQVHGAVFDVGDEQAMDAALAALPEGFRDIDALINNAGLALGTSPAQDAKLADWRTMVQTNVIGLMTLTHKLLPKLIERKGSIINASPSVGANGVFDAVLVSFAPFAFVAPSR